MSKYLCLCSELLLSLQRRTKKDELRCQASSVTKHHTVFPVLRSVRWVTLHPNECLSFVYQLNSDQFYRQDKRSETAQSQAAYSGLAIFFPHCSVSEKMDCILMGINKGDWPGSEFSPFVLLATMWEGPSLKAHCNSAARQLLNIRLMGLTAGPPPP